MSVPLDKFLSATFGSNGEARITALPDRARDVWQVTRYVCHTSANVPTELAVYLGSESAGSRIDHTGSGNDDVSEQITPLSVSFGRALIFVWKNGNNGATAEISIYGMIDKV